MTTLKDGILAAVKHLQTAKASFLDWSHSQAIAELRCYANALPWEPPQTPYVAVDCVILTADLKKVALIQRKFPPLGLALPGGFVDMGETLAHAAAREVNEEVGIDVKLNPGMSNAPFFIMDDNPSRDPRRHVITAVFYALVPTDTKLVAGDDAAHAEWFDLQTVLAKNYEVVLGHGDFIQKVYSFVSSKTLYHNGEDDAC